MSHHHHHNNHNNNGGGGSSNPGAGTALADRPSEGDVYTILKGRITGAKVFGQNPRKRPHYHLMIENADGKFDVAINIASEDKNIAKVPVLYAIKDASNLPNLAAIKAFNGTAQNLEGADRQRLGLDYTAQGHVTREQMKELPVIDAHAAVQGDNDIIRFIDPAVNNDDAEVFAFGRRYSDNAPRDPAWGFSPDDGVHNIHMNQGNARGNHDDENGRWHDGGLLIHFKSTDQWKIAYVAFQTQTWNNDDNGFPK
jgi:uncharacterized protein YukJ